MDKSKTVQWQASSSRLERTCDECSGVGWRSDVAGQESRGGAPWPVAITRLAPRP